MDSSFSMDKARIHSQTRDRKIDIFKNYEANGVEKIQRKLEIFSTLISKKSIERNQITAYGLVSN